MPIWDKIAELTGKDDNDHPKVATEQKGEAQPLPPANTDASVKDKDHDWSDKFRDLLDGGASNRREAEEERLRLERERIEKEEAALAAEKEASSFRAKIKDIFDGDDKAAEEEKHRLKREADLKRLDAERAKLREESWSHKIKSAFKDDDDDAEREAERQRLAEEAKRNASFGAKVRGFFQHDTAPAEEKKSFGDKFISMLEKDDEPAKERHWFEDKFHSIAGGGHKAETKEDKLDKLIDVYQSRVLKRGNQTNESAAEQAKDKLLAASIRKTWKSMTGKEFPIKDDDDDK